MAAIQGRLGELWAQTADAAAAFTAEACDVVSGTTYQITNAAKRQWDPATAVLVYDGGVLQTSGYSLEPTVGRILFDGAPSGAVTVTGAYLATAQVGFVTGWELSISSQVFEVTALGDTVRTYIGDELPNWSGSFEKYHESTDEEFSAHALDNATSQSLVIKLYEDEPSDRVYVGYGTLTNWSQSTPLELVTESIQFQGVDKLAYIADET